MGRLDIVIGNGKEGSEGREGGTHGDDVVDDLERGVAISELAVL
jgi:hypothetical protein